MLTALPAPETMYQAIVDRDTTFDGVFFAGIKTTGVFCRPGCGARRPNPENVEYFASASTALHAGYRACKRCRPLDPAGAAPGWVAGLLARIDADPGARITAADLRRGGIDPAAASRYFKSRFGMTFQGYSRARRVGMAMHTLRGGGTITRAAALSGYASESGLRDAFTRLFGAPPMRGMGVPLVARWLTTPLGPMLAVASDRGLAMLEFVDRRAIEAQVATLRRRFGTHVVPGEHPLLAQVERELVRYFAGQAFTFAVPLADPGTPFQRQVWEALRQIPPGQTRSYAQLARALGRPTAARAVARANGDNRIAIIIPCHRVIGSDGSPTGYAGGIWRKEWLLRHERGEPAEQLFTP